MAERLLILSKITKLGTAHLDIRDHSALEPAMEFAEALPMRDEKALRRALQQMPKNVVALFANPLVRQLTAGTPDEMPTGAAVAGALDILANSALVGLRHEPTTFLSGFSELLEIDPATLPRVPKFAAVASLAQLLERTGSAKEFLEKDIELYRYITAAFNKSP